MSGNQPEDSNLIVGSRRRLSIQGPSKIRIGEREGWDQDRHPAQGNTKRDNKSDQKKRKKDSMKNLKRGQK